LPIRAVPRSAIEGQIWPAIPSGSTCQILALAQQLQSSQWWAPETLRGRQFQQLGHLLRHAFTTAPFHQARLAAAGYKPEQAITPEFWRSLPLLTRRQMQEQHDALLSTRVPESHGRRLHDATSGSTGMPVRIVKTDFVQILWHAMTLREELWQRRDWRLTLGVIRRDPKGESTYPGRRHPDWGAPLGVTFPTGPAELLDTRTPVEEQAEWLMRVQPGYLLSFPSIIEELARHCLARDLRPRALRGIRTFGEVVDPDLRDLCREAWSVEIADMYSAVEVGYIALQCPTHGQYHVQSEVMLVEVIDEHGRECAPGEIGQVVLTSLHNYAMPILRYAPGDYAEVGERCPCGRGLPVLRRILGRSRDMVTLPSGIRQFPLLGINKALATIDALVQFQLAQTSLEDIEVRLVTRRPLTTDEASRLRELFNANLGHEFRMTFAYHAQIPRSAGGKFFDFVSELPE
jgi:phenylacetate-CoA ligase